MEVLEKIVKELPNHLIEVSLTKSQHDNLFYKSNKINDANSGENTKLGIRVTKGLRSGFAWTNNLSQWRDCVHRAKKLMEASSELKLEPSVSKTQNLSKRFIHQSFNKATIETLKDKAELLINAVRDVGAEVADLIITKELTNKSFINSNLTTHSVQQSAIKAEVECAKDNSSSFDESVRQGLTIDFESLGKNTAQLCVNSLNAKKIKPQLTDVVVDYNALNGLINLLIPSLLANNVLENNSFLKDKIGQQLFNESITINDVGSIINGTNNQLTDAEGVKIKDKPLFQQGVLKNYLNDLYTAKRLNVMASGNSIGLMKRGLIGVNNIVIEPGEANHDEILNDCVYINCLMGLHTANTISGDFALSALNAFKYEKGIKTPIRDLMVSGNIFKLFNQIKMISKELRHEGNFKAPLIKFKNVQLVG